MLLVGLFLLVAAVGNAQTVRYFGVWSYPENAPFEEIVPERLPERKLGYRSLELDEAASVRPGTDHGSSGEVWLSFL